jgi:hypothetical protein
MTESRVAIGDRVLIVTAMTLLAGFLAIPHIGVVRASDFDQLWYGARALVHGANPYEAVGPGRTFPWQFPLFYPLPGVLLAVPFTAVPVRMASLIFSAISGGALALALTHERSHRVAALASFSFFYAVAVSQWSPLFVAAAVFPVLGVLFVAKPTIGAAIWLYRPSWKTALACAAVLALSVIIRPSWPGEWLAGLGAATHIVAPITYPGGALVLLALARWRRPEARLLVAMACVPQTTLLYEVLPLFLIPNTWRQSWMLVALTWLVQGIEVVAGPFPLLPDRVAFSGKLALALCYLPCVVMVLMRPNEGKLPLVLETALDRMAGWWRASIPGGRSAVPATPHSGGADVGS